MGLFSKTKTYIESTSVPLFAETKGSLEQTIINAVVQDRSISDDLLTTSLNGLGRKSKVFLSYAKKNYTYGLPEGTVEVKHAGARAIQAVLEAVVDSDALLEFSSFGIADATMFSREHLIVNRGWNPDTNIVSNPNFTPVGTVTLYSAEWVTNTTIKLSYLHDTVTNLATETITVPYTDYTKQFYHAVYTIGSSPTLYYWFYSPSEGLYETLNVYENVFESEYFPVVPIIRDNVDLTDDSKKDTELYRTSKRLLDKMGLDFKKIGSGVQESPDISAVDHAYINVSADVQSESKNIKAYLFEHFDYLLSNQEFDKEYSDNWAESGVLPPGYNKITVKETENDSGEIGAFHTELGFRYIEESIITGNLGKIGTVTRETIIRSPLTSKFYNVEDSYMLWNKQISDTQYRQLKVVGLKHINYVYGNKTIDTSLEDSLEEDSDDFNIMVNVNVLNRFPIIKRGDILNDCFRICLNSVERVKLKWYQTSIFKALIIIIAAVITLYTGGDAISWAIGLTGATSYVVQLAVAILLNTLLSVLTTKLIDVIGLKNFALIQIFIIAYSIYTGDISLLTPDTLIRLVSGVNLYFTGYLQDEYAQLLNEYEQLKAEQEEDQAELDKLIEALPSSFLDPMTFLDTMALNAVFGETPEQYYNTRIHTGNIGTLALAEPSKFVEINTQLEGISDRTGLNIL